MPDTVDAYYNACLQLANRYSEVTGDSYRAAVTLRKTGGVTVDFLKRPVPEAAPDDSYELEYSEHMSLIRALDSLTLAVATGLQHNNNELRLAGIRIGEYTARQGVVALDLSCPAWSKPATLYCRYAANLTDNQTSITLHPMARGDLSDEQAVVWDDIYAAGVGKSIDRILPWITTGIAQLLTLNCQQGFEIGTIAFVFNEGLESIILGGFPNNRPNWKLKTQGAQLYVEGTPGEVNLSVNQRNDLTLAVARWQAMHEAIMEHRGMIRN